MAGAGTEHLLVGVFQGPGRAPASRRPTSVAVDVVAVGSIEAEVRPGVPPRRRWPGPPPAAHPGDDLAVGQVDAADHDYGSAGRIAWGVTRTLVGGDRDGAGGPAASGTPRAAPTPAQYPRGSAGAIRDVLRPRHRELWQPPAARHVARGRVQRGRSSRDRSARGWLRWAATPGEAVESRAGGGGRTGLGDQQPRDRRAGPLRSSATAGPHLLAQSPEHTAVEGGPVRDALQTSTGPRPRRSQVSIVAGAGNRSRARWVLASLRAPW